MEEKIKEETEEIVESEFFNKKDRITRKERRDKKNFLFDKDSTFNKIMNVILWIIVLVWIGICVTDYVLTLNDKSPVFCIKEQTKTYDDGTVYQCTGLGYKYFEYNRRSYNAKQFANIFVKEYDPTK